MSNSLSQAQPTLVIDCRSNRIRIHRKTLHMLGDPEYVQILIIQPPAALLFVPAQINAQNVSIGMPLVKSNAVSFTANTSSGRYGRFYLM